MNRLQLESVAALKFVCALIFERRVLSRQIPCTASVVAAQDIEPNLTTALGIMSALNAVDGSRPSAPNETAASLGHIYNPQN